MTVEPRHVICALGNWHTFSDITELLKTSFPDFEFDSKYSILEPDNRMQHAFQSSFETISPTAQDEDLQAIKDHHSVSYILSPPITPETAMTISGKTLLLVEALFQHGAVAIKNESSGIAHGRLRWLHLAKEFKQAQSSDDQGSMGGSLYYAWVRRALQDKDQGEDILYTVGMHLLGYPDSEFSPLTEPEQAIKWVDLLNLYLCMDRPTRRLFNGEGFKLDSHEPRRIINKRSCFRYASDDFFYNPFGYNRLIPEGTPANKIKFD